MHKEKEPEYMVQINDPKMLRKDLLEALREVIIFMQGYEKFKAIQQEKVKTFAELRSDTRELQSLVDRLRKLVPKGSLKPVRSRHEKVLGEEAEPEHEEAEETPEAAPKRAPSELDELEDQLREIEGQLQGI